MKCLSSRLAVVLVQSIEAKCLVATEDVVGAAPTPTTSELSTFFIAHQGAAFGGRQVYKEQAMMLHDDVIKWKHFPRYWPSVRGIQRSQVKSPHKGQ